MIKAPESRKRQRFLHGVVQMLLARLRASASPDDALGVDNAEIARMARDLCVTGSDLRALAQTPAGSTLLLYRRLATLRLDPQNSSRIQPGVVRDLQLHCSMCDSKMRCAEDLALGTLDSSWQDYCPNAPTLRALVAAYSASDEIEDLIVYLKTIREPVGGQSEEPGNVDRKRRH